MILLVRRRSVEWQPQLHETGIVGMDRGNIQARGQLGEDFAGTGTVL